jgi:4-amino-4-deoxy-L-arabinose transferase-like glycosyltransferase
MNIKAIAKHIDPTWSLTATPTYIVPMALFVLAALLRFYRIDNNPLWMDEIYGILLMREGTRALILNSLTDPHPPLYYLLQWLSSGAGMIQSEFAWRLLPALSGALTVPLVYWLGFRMAGRNPAFIAALLFAISPAHIYFSQESRSTAFLTFLATLSVLMVYRLLQLAQTISYPSLRLWLGLIAVSLVGLHSGYNYALILGIQGCFLLAFWGRSRFFWLYAGSMAGGLLMLLPFLGSLAHNAAQHASISAPLNLPLLSQSLLAGEPLRFGLSWPHIWIPLMMVTITIIGCVSILWPKRSSAANLYLVVQLFLPLLLFFAAAAPLFDLRLPAGESKLFMLLLPVFYALAAPGFQKIFQWAGFRPALVLVGVLFAFVLAGSLSSLNDYWSSSKSPEGQAVRYLRQNYQEGDVVISLHHSLNAAMAYYLPQADLYTYPLVEDGSYWLSQAVGVLRLPRSMVASTPRTPLEEVRAHPRIWLLSKISYPLDFTQALLAECTTQLDREYYPFRAVLMSSCQP